MGFAARQTNAVRTTVNICYLEFVNFSLGASGMVRQNLQNNDTVSLSVFFQIIKITSRAR